MSAPAQRGYIGLGAGLSYSTDSGSTWHAVARVSEIGALSFGEADKVDVTGYDTPTRAREYIKGMEDTADVDLTGIWTADESQIALMSLDNVIGWKVEFPPTIGGVWTAQGYITGFSINLQLEDRIEWSATLVVSGKPSYTGPLTGGDDDDAGDDDDDDA